ncbi:MAG: hypothetical protein ACI8QC_002879 [Planctomycetota bacterium]|jgi:hypothetical protein
MASNPIRIRTRCLLGVALSLGVVSMGVPERAGRPSVKRAVLGQLELQTQELQGAAEAFRRDHGHWPGFEDGPALEPRASVQLLRRDLLERSPHYLSNWPLHALTGSDHIRRTDRPADTILQATRPAWLWTPSSGLLQPAPSALPPQR